MINTVTTYEAKCDLCGRIEPALSSFESPPGWMLLVVYKRIGPVHQRDSFVALNLIACLGCEVVAKKLHQLVEGQ